jgi:hypothetical protein
VNATRLWVAISAAVAITCIPNLGPGDSLITSTRILALRADPAEAVPGTLVTFTSFVVDSTGALSGSPIAWDFCTAPRPLTDDNIVSNACLNSSSVLAAGYGPSVTAVTPANGCSLFGPDTPPGGFRPSDPDSTGGYYQPLRATLRGSDDSFALVRIYCDLAQAPGAVASAFAAAYTRNHNPTLLPLTGAIGGVQVALKAIPAGALVTFTASWPATSAETFAYFDPATEALTTQRESMQVAWYSTAGAFETESTGRASTDLATTSDDTWSAPSVAGRSQIFLVLRDSRGGIDFGTYDVLVTR